MVFETKIKYTQLFWNTDKPLLVLSTLGLPIIGTIFIAIIDKIFKIIAILSVIGDTFGKARNTIAEAIFVALWGFSWIRFRTKIAARSIFHWLEVFHNPEPRHTDATLQFSLPSIHLVVFASQSERVPQSCFYVKVTYLSYGEYSYVNNHVPNN